MNGIRHIVRRLEDFLLAERSGRTATIFCKVLYGFLFIKILFMWTTYHEVISSGVVKFPVGLRSVFYAPLFLGAFNLDILLVSAELLLAFALIIRLNYYNAFLIFWTSLSLSQLTLPIINGSDQVLNLFLFLAILLPRVSAAKLQHSAGERGRAVLSNFGLLVCRVQLSLIYFLSGYDKIISPAWRSGDAIFSISHLDFFVRPMWAQAFPIWLYGLASWLVIIFELAFPFLIWFRRTQKWTIIAGIIFHLGIIFILNLPDFGVIMIVVYAMFIPELNWFRLNWEKDS
jgi:Vitamin K-dependent gamma-carboxylase